MFDTNGLTIPPPLSSVHWNQQFWMFPWRSRHRAYANVCANARVRVSLLASSQGGSVRAISLCWTGQWGVHRVPCRPRPSHCLTSRWHRRIHAQQVRCSSSPSTLHQLFWQYRLNSPSVLQPQFVSATWDDGREFATHQCCPHCLSNAPVLMS